MTAVEKTAVDVLKGAHTSEQWEVIGDDPANLHVVQADAPHLRVCFLTSNGPTEERARLIAAAPDLLEALRRLLATTAHNNDDKHEDGCRCVIHEARAAIAKAS